VAPLTTAADSARSDAKRLQSDARGLKLVARGNLARSRERLGRAQAETDRVQARRAVPAASPWSALEWLRDDEQLGRVLVPLD
jgi:hypothetical protein